MADPFESFRAGLESPAEHHYEVTLESPGPTVLDPQPRYLYVLTTGDVEIVDEDENSILYDDVPAHTILPFRAYALGGGTVADIIAWY